MDRDYSYHRADIWPVTCDFGVDMAYESGHPAG